MPEIAMLTSSRVIERRWSREPGLESRCSLPLKLLGQSRQEWGRDNMLFIWEPSNRAVGPKRPSQTEVVAPDLPTAGARSARCCRLLSGPAFRGWVSGKRCWAAALVAGWR